MQSECSQFWQTLWKCIHVKNENEGYQCKISVDFNMRWLQHVEYFSIVLKFCLHTLYVLHLLRIWRCMWVCLILFLLSTHVLWQSFKAFAMESLYMQRIFSASAEPRKVRIHEEFKMQSAALRPVVGMICLGRLPVRMSQNVRCSWLFSCLPCLYLTCLILF